MISLAVGGAELRGIVRSVIPVHYTVENPSNMRGAGFADLD
jgi:hypothetical protein